MDLGADVEDDGHHTEEAGQHEDGSQVVRALVTVVHVAPCRARRVDLSREGFRGVTKLQVLHRHGVTVTGVRRVDLKERDVLQGSHSCGCFQL